MKNNSNYYFLVFLILEVGNMVSVNMSSKQILTCSIKSLVVTGLFIIFDYFRSKKKGD